MTALTKIEYALKAKTKKGGKSNIFTASMICFYALEVSEGLYQPLCFKNGILSVAVANPASASNIMLSQNAICEKINERIGTNLVKKIRIKQKYQ